MRHVAILAVLSALALVSTAEDVSRGVTCIREVTSDTNEYNCSGIVMTTKDRDKAAMINCRGQPLDCSKLEQLTTGNNKLLTRLVIQNCAVNSSLECVLAKLNATGVKKLWFMAVSTLITEETVQGLDMLEFLLVSNGVQTLVPVEAMKLLPQLTELRLQEDRMTTLTPNIFNQSGIPSLDYLELSLNELTTLPADSFNGLKNLRTLNLYKSKIENVDANTFRGLDSLLELNLDVNSISLLPAGVFLHTPQLINLTIPMNQVTLTVQSGALSSLANLKKLILQSYKELHLEPRSLSELPALQTLELQESGITELPADLFHNTNSLIELNLSGNELSSLPETVFEGLEKLQKLDLKRNKLKVVTNQMFHPLESIKELYLDGNLIEILPEFLFSTQPSLRTVSFAHNNIHTVNSLAFQGAAVTNLDLSHNKLEWSCYQDDGTFSYDYNSNYDFQSPLVMLDRMDTLNLSHNSIGSVCNDWKQIMTVLRYLDLSFNKLTNLTNADTHFSSPRLISVDMRDNKIATIEPPSYQRNSTLILGQNPFHCDCHLYKFLKQLKNLSYNVNNAQCALPITLKGRTLSSLATGSSYSTLSLNNLTCPLSDTPEGCICIVRPAMTRTECNCDNLRNKTLPNPTSNGPEINEMALTLRTQQNLHSIPVFVTELGLPGLGLTTVPYFPESVKHVDLRNNNLSRVPLEILQRNITFQLSGNKIECDCWSQEDVGNLKNNLNKINDYKSVYCEDGGDLEQVDVPRLCNVFYAIVIGTSLGVIGLILAIVGTVVYKYSLEIKIYLYYRGFTWLVKEEMLDVNKEYDIFLSYVHKDVEFVKTNIQAVLDKDYKVCVHDRDWIVGDKIEDQIYRSVAQSRRTLIVLSNAFIESNSWALTEFEAAHAQTIVDQLPRAVVILLEDVNSDNAPDHIKRHMKTNTYIQWGDSMFWERLRYALPRKMKATDLRKRHLGALAVKNFAKKGLNVVLNEQGDLVNVADIK